MKTSSKIMALGRRIVTVNTGLSSSVAGCIVTIDRDDAARVGTVVVQVPQNIQLMEVQRSAVHQTAKLLGERAKRFLGMKWTIIPWSGFSEG